MRWKHSGHDAGAGHGFTLVEVLAGLALLGTLMATAMLVKARYTRQMAMSNRRLEAVAATDAMLQAWWAKKTLPHTGSGDVPGDLGLTWRTTTHNQVAKTNHPVELETTRLEILDRRNPHADGPILTLELLFSANLPVLQTAGKAQHEP